MLTVPDTIKTLFKSDSVYKNFRAVVLDGPEPDITNASIVRESLRFTESVCSNNAFRFGGGERSVIEFETVGVGNIQGRLISCNIEIDTTSLTAAQLTAIGADPGDGTLVLASASDIGRGYYRIPLGVFRVASCPRDSRQKTHRKITAYTPRPWRMNPVERAKLDWVSNVKTYAPDAELLALGLVEYNCPGFMASQGWTKTKVYGWDDANSPPQSASFSKTVTLTGSGGSQQVTISGTRKYEYFHIGYGMEIFGLCQFDVGSAPAKDIVDWLTLYVDGAYVLESGMQLGPVKITNTEDFIRWSLWEACVSMQFVDDYAMDSNLNYRTVALSGSVPAFYASMSDPAHPLTGRNYLLISVPDTVTITVTEDGSTSSQTFTMGATAPVLYQWGHTSPPAAIPLTIQATDSFDWTNAAGDPCTYNTFLDGYDPASIVQAVSELHGRLLKAGRGLPGYATLDLAPTVAITPGDIEQAWWNDEPAEPIGQVTYNFGENHDTPGVWGSITGWSVYDLTGNDVLAQMTSPSAATINGMIERLMMAGLDAVYLYSSADITMPAWPWLEAGDCVELYSEDPDEDPVCVCFLSRTISGVQRLVDSVSASMGTAEDSDE